VFRAGDKVLNWPSRLVVRFASGLAMGLLAALSVLSFVAYEWNLRTAEGIPAERTALVWLERAADEQRGARRLGQEFVLNGSAAIFMAQGAMLAALNADLAQLKSDAEGSGELAADVEGLSVLAARQASLSRILWSRRQALGPGLPGAGAPVEAGVGPAARNGALETAGYRSEENFSAAADLFRDARYRQLRAIERLAWREQATSWTLLASMVLTGLVALAYIGAASRSLQFFIAREDSSLGSLKHVLSFMNSTSDAVYGIDLEGRCTFYNRAFLRLVGHDSGGRLLGMKMHALLFPDQETKGEPCRMLAAARAGKGLYIEEATARTSKGAALSVDCRSSLVYEEEAVVGAAITLGELSGVKAAREAARLALSSLEQQVRDLSRHSTEMVLFGQLAEMLQACASTGELCKVVANSARDLFPEGAGSLYVLDAAGQLLEPQISWGRPEVPDHGPFGLQDCWSLRRGKPHYQVQSQKDIYCTHVLGDPASPAFTFCLPLAGQGITLGLLHLRSGSGYLTLSEAQQDVAIALAYQVALGLSNLRLKENLRDEAIRDPTTGLFNRRFMNESLDTEIAKARKAGTTIGVIAFDLDHFKEVNDTHGHAAGDRLLRSLAGLSVACVGPDDILCRQGGDEFLAILPAVTEATALVQAEWLRVKVEAFTRDQLPGLAGRATLSAGVAIFPQDANTSEGLQKAADRALYQSKVQGRNCVNAASSLVPVGPVALLAGQTTG